VSTLTQADVAEKMGVTKSRVSQVERGEVSTIEAVARYVQAIGGTIQVSAVPASRRLGVSLCSRWHRAPAAAAHLAHGCPATSQTVGRQVRDAARNIRLIDFPQAHAELADRDTS
jgi:helix-turn-helix protein